VSIREGPWNRKVGKLSVIGVGGHRQIVCGGHVNANFHLFLDWELKQFKHSMPSTFKKDHSKSLTFDVPSLLGQH